MLIHEDHKHVYYKNGDEVAGEITFKPVGSKKIIIDHTHVHSDHRGEGIAEDLVYSVVERMRKEGKKIVPLCPFAKKEFERNADYQDVYSEK
ncbi:putative GNAT family acetyltransferase [Alkalihalobacillus xiaoxiensis]|uniref:GNAT family acetyltransferase n=1 Tax=Shouchella xiaoxiensis TaxID=766895 RepID=A0ABS2SNV3_9BACI|nr:GNAT family N-acetyltransferase [Shouchella xiaoxiensis]MBM7837193.1 putative GNAT family acetyltransferase [Shouchella xiaoxiensis]